MSGNLDSDRSVTAGKMYPIDLAQKITIVKSVSNAEVKMAHLISQQPKTTATGQIITHTGSVGLMRPAAQILSPGVSSQPQIIVSGSPILQATQIVSQGSQIISQNTQIISQPQLIPSGQILSPGTQIISQGTQLSAQVSNSVSNSVQVSIPSSMSGAQVLSVGGQLVSGSQGIVTGATNVVVSPSVRTLPHSVRVLPPLPHHNTRPAVLSSVNVNNTGGVLVNKGVTSHVPRGLAAGASLAVRPATPTCASHAISGQGAWSVSGRGRGALVYGARGAAPAGRAAPPRQPSPAPATAALPLPLATQQQHSTQHTPQLASQLSSTLTPQHSQQLTTQHTSQHSQQHATQHTSQHATQHTSQLASQLTAQHTTQHTPHSALVTLPTTTVLTSSVAVSSRAAPAAAASAAPRPLPLLQRNFQPAKVVGVAAVGVGVGVRGAVGNSAPAQLYYEVPRPQAAHAHAHRPPYTHIHHHQGAVVPPAAAAPQPEPRPLAPYALHEQQATIVNAVQTPPEARPPPAVSVTCAPALLRPTILRKRDVDGSPSKVALQCGVPGWEGGECEESVSGSGGSTTVSAASSPARDDPDPHPAPTETDLEPRKKPRKQMLATEIRQCHEFHPEEARQSPPATNITPPKRPQLSSSYICGWRPTALHFARPADVRRREARPKDILAIASQRHVLTSAEGWKVSLETDVGSQLADILHSLEGIGGRAQSALKPHTHTLTELLKGNIQRSKIVCEGVQEAREDILRVFTHRNFVADILTRQADKRCFRKHRSQS